MDDQNGAYEDDDQKYEYRTVGPPGCGKTTWLSGQVGRAHESGRNVLVMSLTRASAAEVAGRNLPIAPQQVGTLHSQCFHALGRPSVAENKSNIKEWNEDYPMFAITPNQGATAETVDRDNLDAVGDNSGDRMMMRYQRLRAMMVPRERYPKDIAEFDVRWRDWKTQGGLMDFTDMIEACLEDIDQAPTVPDIIFVDEAQDLDLLEMGLIRKWGLAARYLVVVGDPDQCQPPGTIITTTEGPVPIEDLDPHHHLLVCRDQKAGALTRDGFPFQAAERPYRGPMVTVTTARGRSTRCTPEHLWPARWTQDGPSRWAVCVLQKSTTWLFALTELPKNRQHEALSDKLWAENAQALWVLGTHRSHRDASLRVTGAAAQYPGADNSDGMTKEQAHRCLSEAGRSPRFPIMQRSNTGHPLREARTCNLLPLVMEIPEARDNGRSPFVKVHSTESQDYDGPVHSLEVEPHHTYIADQLATHNCLYRWRGSDPDAFTNPEIPKENWRLLSQSYRLPNAVYQKAISWINQSQGRAQVEYHPRDEEGAVRHLQASWDHPREAITDAEAYMAQGKSVMFLATCSYMLVPLVNELRERGIPFHNPQRKSNGAWNPLQHRPGQVTATDRILAWLNLSESGIWTAEDIRRWTSVAKVKETLSGRGLKAEIEALEDDADLGDQEPSVSWERMLELLLPETIDAGLGGDLDWYIERMTTSGQGPARFPARVAKTWGSQALREEPLLTPGTVHSVKGGEASVVYLFPDLSKAGMNEWTGDDQQKASVYRLFYVGMTRAKETLVLCETADDHSGPPLKDKES